MKKFLLSLVVMLMALPLSLQAAEETVTLELGAGNELGLSTKTYSKGDVIATSPQGIVLTCVQNVKYSGGLLLTRWTQGSGTFTVSSTAGEVTAVTVTQNKGAASDILVKIQDGVATVSNESDMDDITITALKVTFGSDGLQPANISFPAKSKTLINGVDEISGLALTNPDNLPVTYSSSSEDILVNAATGEITLAPGASHGTATITATFAGNDTYRKGEASYEITINACANSLAELLLIAPKAKDVAYVNFPLAVIYSSGYYAMVQSMDGETNAILYGSTFNYAPNSVIPAGWTATGYTLSGVTSYKMSPLKTTVEGEVAKNIFVPVVDAVTTADVTNVVVLKNVTFDKATTANMGVITGYVGDVEYNFYNMFKVASVEAGTYDVKGCVVLYSGKPRLWIIEYMPAGSAVEIPLTTPDVADYKVSITGDEKIEFDNVNNEFVVTSVTAEESATLTVAVPRRYDNLAYMDPMSVSPMSMRAGAIDTDYWMPMEFASQNGLKLGNEVAVPADGNPHQYAFLLVKDNMVYMDTETACRVMVTVSQPAKVPTPAYNELKLTVSGESTVTVDNEAETISVATTVPGTTATVALAIPEGFEDFDGFAYMPFGGAQASKAAADTENSDWVPFETIAAAMPGLTKGNVLTVDADGQTYGFGLYLMKGDNVYTAKQYLVDVTAKSTLTVDVVDLSSITPADNSIFATWQKFNTVSFKFGKAGNINAFDFMKVNTELAEPIKVYQVGADKETLFCEILASDTQNVKMDKSFTTQVNITIPKELVMFGETPVSYYRIEVPQGLCIEDKDIPSEGATEDEVIVSTTRYTSPACSAQYGITVAPEYKVSLASSNTYTVLGGELSKFTVTYDEGTVLESLNSDAKAVLKLFKSGSATEVGTYTMSIEGTVVTFTTDVEIGIANSSSLYYQISVPAGLYTAKGISGVALENPAINLDKVKTIWIGTGAIELEGLKPVGETYAKATDFPLEFITALPVPVNFDASKKAQIKCGTAVYGEAEGVMAPDGKSVLWTLTPDPNATVIKNKPEWWGPGSYSITIPANTFIDKADASIKSAALTFGNWTVEEGCSYDPKTRVIGNYYGGLNVYSGFVQSEDGKSNTPGTKQYTIPQINEDAFGAIPSSDKDGIFAIQVRFLQSCKPNVESEAKMSFTRSGDAEAMWTITPPAQQNTEYIWASGNNFSVAKYGSPLWGAPLANGQDWYIVLNGLKQDGPTFEQSAGSATAAPNMAYVPTFVTEPGTYTLHADKGFFVQANGTPSEELNITFTVLPSGFEPVVSPESGSSVKELKTITLTYPEGTSVSVKEDAKVQLESSLAVSSGENTRPFFSITGSGNVVTLALDEPYAELAKYAYAVKIPAATWEIDYKGAKFPNPTTELKYLIDQPTAGTVTPEPGVVDPEQLSSIEYTSPSKLYTVGNAYLYPVVDGKRGEASVATYSGKKAYATAAEEEAEGPSMKANFTMSTEDVELADGEYMFVIPAASLTYDSSLQGTVDFEYTYTVVNKVVVWGELKDHLEINLPSSLDANPVNTNGMGMSMVGYAVNTKDIVMQGDSEPIQLLYAAKEGDEPKVIATVPLTDEHVLFMGVSPFEEGLVEFNAVQYMYVSFISQGEEDAPATTAEDDADIFMQEGLYTVVFPDGAFMIGEEMMRGTSFTYTFSTEIPAADMEYELTPADDSQVGDAKTAFNETGITIHFTKAKLVDIKDNAAQLVMPDGTVLVDNLPDFVGGYPSTKMTFKFGRKDTEWQTGDYQFVIKEGMIGVDMGYIDDYLDPSDYVGNFPGLKAVYHASSNTGILVIGIDKADAYNVYTMDGKVVKLNAQMEDLMDLAPGLYIINGQKAMLRK